jgi:hypothetical protein
VPAIEREARHERIARGDLRAAVRRSETAQTLPFNHTGLLAAAR